MASLLTILVNQYILQTWYSYIFDLSSFVSEMIGALLLVSIPVLQGDDITRKFC